MKKDKNLKGFTLVEEVVSLLILSILILVASGMMIAAMRVYAANVKTQTAQNKGQYVYELLENKLSYASGVQYETNVTEWVEGSESPTNETYLNNYGETKEIFDDDEVSQEVKIDKNGITNSFSKDDNIDFSKYNIEVELEPVTTEPSVTADTMKDQELYDLLSNSDVTDTAGSLTPQGEVSFLTNLQTWDNQGNVKLLSSSTSLTFNYADTYSNTITVENYSDINSIVIYFDKNGFGNNGFMNIGYWSPTYNYSNANSTTEEGNYIIKTFNNLQGLVLNKDIVFNNYSNSQWVKAVVYFGNTIAITSSSSVANLKTGDSQTLTLTANNCEIPTVDNFSMTSTDGGEVLCELTGNQLTITGIKAGSVKISIPYDDNQSCDIDVTIEDPLEVTIDGNTYKSGDTSEIIDLPLYNSINFTTNKDISYRITDQRDSGNGIDGILCEDEGSNSYKVTSKSMWNENNILFIYVTSKDGTEKVKIQIQVKPYPLEVYIDGDTDTPYVNGSTATVSVENGSSFDFSTNCTGATVNVSDANYLNYSVETNSETGMDDYTVNAIKYDSNIKTITVEKNGSKVTINVEIKPYPLEVYINGDTETTYTAGSTASVSVEKESSFDFSVNCTDANVYFSSTYYLNYTSTPNSENNSVNYTVYAVNYNQYNTNQTITIEKDGVKVTISVELKPYPLAITIDGTTYTEDFGISIGVGKTVSYTVNTDNEFSYSTNDYSNKINLTSSDITANEAGTGYNCYISYGGKTITIAVTCIESLSITNVNTYYQLSENDTLQVTTNKDNESDYPITYQSSDESVATVDENGLITAVGEGTAEISVSSEKDSNTDVGVKKITVQVYKEFTVTIDGIEYKKDNTQTLYMKKGDELDYSTSRPDTIEFQCQWSSDVFLSQGKLKSNASGSFTLVFKSLNEEIDIPVKIFDSFINASDKTVIVGENVDLDATLNQDCPSDMSLKYLVSEGSDIVSADSDGNATGLKIGTAKLDIQAVVGSKVYETKTVTISVVDTFKVTIDGTEHIAGNSDKIYLLKGQTYDVSSSRDDTTFSCEWNDGVTVSGETLTANNVGSYTLVFKSLNEEIRVTAVVVDSFLNVTEKQKVAVGETLGLDGKLNSDSPKDMYIKYALKDKVTSDIIDLQDNLTGMIKGKSAGTENVEIYAVIDDKIYETKTIEVTVYNPLELTSNNSSITVFNGDTIAFPYTFNHDYKTISDCWECKVSDDRKTITFNNTGSYNLTFTDEDGSSVAVTVNVINFAVTSTTTNNFDMTQDDTLTFTTNYDVVDYHGYNWSIESTNESIISADNDSKTIKAVAVGQAQVVVRLGNNEKYKYYITVNEKKATLSISNKNLTLWPGEEYTQAISSTLTGFDDVEVLRTEYSGSNPVRCNIVNNQTLIVKAVDMPDVDYQQVKIILVDKSTTLETTGLEVTVTVTIRKPTISTSDISLAVGETKSLGISNEILDKVTCSFESSNIEVTSGIVKGLVPTADPVAVSVKYLYNNGNKDVEADLGTINVTVTNLTTTTTAPVTAPPLKTTTTTTTYAGGGSSQSKGAALSSKAYTLTVKVKEKDGTLIYDKTGVISLVNYDDLVARDKIYESRFPSNLNFKISSDSDNSVILKIYYLQ